VWLAPEQAVVITVSEKQNDYAVEVAAFLARQGLRARADTSSDKLGAKKRNARLMRVPYIVVVGDREAAERKVAPWSREGNVDLGPMPLDDFAARLAREAWGLFRPSRVLSPVACGPDSGDICIRGWPTRPRARRTQRQRQRTGHGLTAFFDHAARSCRYASGRNPGAKEAPEHHMAMRRFDPRGGPQRGPQIRINQRIRVPEVRVIGADGEMLGIMQTQDALRRAQEKGLDLVEVNPKAEPPVCKILDFGKFKYDEKKKAREAKRKQSVVEIKEIKLRPKTDDHDLQFKTRAAHRFLEAGHKVKFTVRFRGREITHPEKAQEQLDWIVKECEEIANVEVRPAMEQRTMTLLMAPKPGIMQKVAQAKQAAEKARQKAKEEELDKLEREIEERDEAAGDLNDDDDDEEEEEQAAAPTAAPAK